MLMAMKKKRKKKRRKQREQSLGDEALRYQDTSGLEKAT